jgi:hypothetical protein
MNDLIVLLGIVVWVIGTVSKVVRAGKIAKPPPPGSPPAPPRARRLAPPQFTPAGDGYANRGQLARNPDQARAMSGAAPRLAEGAEYGPIVAERAADRAAELRFAQQTALLISSEPTRAIDRSLPPALDGQTSQVKDQLERLGANKSLLINAVILAEAIGPPLCKKGTARRLRT